MGFIVSSTWIICQQHMAYTQVVYQLVAKWWEIYNDESLDFKAETPAAAEEETFSKPSSIMASMPEPTIPYIPAPSAA
ncbi:hypothetical protein ACFXTH_021270 [Malus domestica]